MSPVIASADWEHINTVRRPCDDAKANTAEASTAYSPDAADHLVNGDSHFVQFISLRKLKAQTISAQTVKLQVQGSETNAGNNCFVTMKIWCAAVDDLANLGTIVNMARDGTELTTSRTNRAHSVTSSSVTTTEDSWLVIEIGIGGTPTGAGGVQGHNGTLWFRDDSATDLPEDDTDTTTTKNPWVEFTNTLLFESSGVLNKTLGALTLDAEGTVVTAGISGTLAKTLADLTQTASGTVVNNSQGTLAKALDALTLVSSGTVASNIVGTLAKTLEALTSVASGTVADAGGGGSPTEHAFSPEFGFGQPKGGFLSKSFMGKFVGKQRKVISLPPQAMKEFSLNVLTDTSWRWPVDREWFERIETKIDNIGTRVTRLEERTKLSSWVVKIVGALVVATCGYLLAGCVPPRSVTTLPEAARQNMMAVTLEVDCVSPDFAPWTAYGSGMAISPRHLVTAYHVIDCDKDKFDGEGNFLGVSDGNAMKITVTMYDGHRFEGVEDIVPVENPIKSYHDKDAAIVVATGMASPFKDYIPIGNSPQVGDTVCSVTGFPLRERKCGVVGTALPTHARYEWMTPPGYFITSGGGKPGNSGSGVVDAAGRLVGVLVAGYEGGLIGGCIGVDYIKDLLDKVPHENTEFGSRILAD